MLKVLLAWEYGGHLGHLGKLLPVARALRQAGHSAAFAMPIGETSRVTLDGQDLVCVPSPPSGTRANDVGASAARREGAVSHAEVLLAEGFGSAVQLRQRVRGWCDLYKRLEPDVVLVDASPVALYAARSLGVGAIAVGHGFDVPPQMGKPCFTPWMPEVAQRMTGSAQALQRVFDEAASTWAGQAERPPRSMDDLYRLEDCCLATWPELDYFERPELEGGRSDIYLGPLWGPLPGARRVDWPGTAAGPKRRRVLCYLYDQPGRFDLVLQALARRGTDVLVLAPGASGAFCSSVRQFGAEVLASPVVIEPLLASCDAVVCHGGMGFSSMALHAGKPLLFLPHYMEHVVLAYQWARNGYALGAARLDHQPTVDEKVARLLEDAGLRRNAAVFADRRGSHRPEDAAQRLVQRLAKPVALGRQ